METIQERIRNGVNGILVEEMGISDEVARIAWSVNNHVANRLNKIPLSEYEPGNKAFDGIGIYILSMDYEKAQVL